MTSSTTTLLQRRAFGSARHAAALRRKAVKIAGAPSSIGEIEDSGLADEHTAVFIRSVGCTRRVFLHKPYLTARQFEGLAYRLRTLSKNEALNSIVVSSADAEGNRQALPTTMVDRDYPYLRNVSVDVDFLLPNDTLVAGGYDPLELYTTSNDTEALLTSLSDYALACRGDARDTIIPTLAIPDGKIQDGGFAIALCSYVLATRNTTFQIQNPSRGLSLDPVGLSYILPRVGREFQQPHATEYSRGVAFFLALTGYTANASDLLETGLATHYVDSTHALGLLEMTLAELPPWNQQDLVKNPIRYHGQPEPTNDHNAEFRNVSVAEAVHNFCSARADGTDLWTLRDDDESTDVLLDPSVEDFDNLPWHEERSSDLINYAATFDDILATESSVLGVLERFREVAARETNDPEEEQGIVVAQDVVRRMEAQSPLALCVVHRLLQEGFKNLETLNSCMARERRVQAKLLAGEDFAAWARYASKSKNNKNDKEEEPFGGWKHASVSEVTPDEVTELVQEDVPLEQVLRGGPPPKK